MTGSIVIPKSLYIIESQTVACLHSNKQPDHIYAGRFLW